MNITKITYTMITLFLLGNLYAQEKKFQREEVDHRSKEVTQARYWTLGGKQILAKVERHYGGFIYLKPTQRNSKIITLSENKLIETDKKELENWDYWSPRKVYFTKTREWELSRYQKKTHSMIKKKVRGKLLYLVGNDAIIQISGKKQLITAGAMDRESRLYLSDKNWRGKSEPMETKGKEADELRNMGLRAYLYKTTIYDKSYELPYQIYKPKKSRRKVPLVIFFHGIGQRGKDNIKQLMHRDPLAFIDPKNQKKYPCYFVAPQHPSGGEGWIGGINTPARSSYLTKELIMELRHAYPDIDPARIYATGLSSGAWGTYQALAHFPEIYASGIPISEAIDYRFFTKENAKPMWILYNKGDKKGIIRDTKILVKHLSKLGVKPRVTAFKNKGHNAWKAAYDKGGIVNWLFRQKMRY